jgi:hypothetical protein
MTSGTTDRVCTNCGAGNPVTSAFCGRCGHTLATPQVAADGVAAAPERRPRRVPDRDRVRAASTRTRKAFRLIRRVGRWGVGALFVGASFGTLWANVDRIPIPFVRNLNVPSFGEVFGGDERDTGGVMTTTTAASGNGEEEEELPREPGTLVDLIEGVEASVGAATVQGAFDGDRTTGWIPCAGCPDPFGVGESLLVRFSRPVTITELAIVNGIDGVDDGLPVATVELDFDQGPTIPLGFQETVQRWRFADERLQVTTRTVTISIAGVFRVDESTGTTALGEIEFIGVPAG